MIHKATRNRRPKAQPAALGTLSLAQWQDDTDRVRWAQTDRTFRDTYTVLVNERSRALAAQPGTTENFQLGVVRGYEIALGVLSDLARGPEKIVQGEEKADYPPETEAGVHDI